jgi:hypothetical protein
MSFSNGKMYTVSVVPKGHRYWSEVQESVDKKINHRLKGQIGKYVITEMYNVRWRVKPFSCSYFKEFKPNRRFFFHGTSSEVIRKILNEGFKVTSVQSAKHGRMLGNGVYVAYHTNKGKHYAPDDYVLSVMVYAPKTLVVGPGESITEAQIKKAASQYDAIEVRTEAIVKYPNQTTIMRNHEICVFDTCRVIPRFILKLTHIKK